MLLLFVFPGCFVVVLFVCYFVVCVFDWMLAVFVFVMYSLSI